MAANDLTHTNHDSTVLDLNDGITYELEEIRGLRNNPGEIVTSDTPYRIPVAGYEGVNPLARNIEIDLIVHGTLGANLDTRLRALRFHFNVDRRDDELGILDYTNFEGTRRQVDVVPWADDPADVQGWLVPGIQGEGWGEVTVKLRALDPTLYGTSWVSQSSNFNGTNAVNVALNNTGDEDGYLDIDVAATVTADWTIEDSYGNVLTFVTGLGGAETLDAYVHPKRKQRFFTGPGGADWRGQLGTGSKLIFAAPGNHNVTFTGGGGGDNGAFTARFRPRYSSM